MFFQKGILKEKEILENLERDLMKKIMEEIQIMMNIGIIGGNYARKILPYTMKKILNIFIEMFHF